MVDIRVGIAEHARNILGGSDPLFGTYMVVPRRVERYRMTEIGFDSEENVVARLNLVDAREVVEGIAEVVHGVTPVTNLSGVVCHDSTNTVLNATNIALSVAA
jgi:hypothetical protein